MTSWVGVIPDEMDSPDKKELFLAWLVMTPYDPKIRKYIMISWYDKMKLKLTREDVITGGAGTF